MIVREETLPSVSVGVGSEDSQKQSSEVAVRVHHKSPVQKEPKGAFVYSSQQEARPLKILLTVSRA